MARTGRQARVAARRGGRDRLRTRRRGRHRTEPEHIFAFELDGVRVVHFGDFGQKGLRREQRQAIGPVDLLFLPVGGGPTIGAEAAAPIVEELEPRWVVPMHYRTERIGFLEPADEFTAAIAESVRLEGTTFETRELPQDGPVAVVPAAP